MIDFTPSEEQALIAETVREFAAKELRPLARKCEEARALPSELLARAHELGLVASALPEAFGGGGARSAVTGVLIAEELAWGDLALALATLSPALGALPIADFGDDAQRRALLPAFLGTAFAPGSNRPAGRATGETRVSVALNRVLISTAATPICMGSVQPVTS